LIDFAPCAAPIAGVRISADGRARPGRRGATCKPRALTQ